MQEFRQLRVWQAANGLSLRVYEITRSFPDNERYILTSQLRRSVVSVQANIAEGFGRGSRADSARFIQMAIGSAAETLSHLHLCHGLGYLTEELHTELRAKVDHIRRMLIRLLLKLRVRRG